MARRAPRQEEEGARKLFDETPQPVAFSGEGKLVIWLQSSQTPCRSGNGGQTMFNPSRYKMYVKFINFDHHYCGKKR